MSVSPRPTWTVSGDPAGIAGDGAACTNGGTAPRRGGGAAAVVGAAATGAAAAAGAATVAGGVAEVVGAATGADERALSPGVYTGGSSSTVYSRIRRPRAQFTSTRKVTNGSGMESVDRTKRTSRPSLALPTLKLTVARKGGLSMP